MGGFLNLVAASGSSGPTTTTFDLTTTIADITVATPSGLALLDTSSGLSSGSVGATGLILTTNTVATALYGAPNAAPQLQCQVTRARDTGVLARARLHEDAAGGTNPEVFLVVSTDLDAHSTKNSHFGIRTGFNTNIGYQNGTTYKAGAANNATIRGDGVWIEAAIGSAGGIYWRYSHDNTSDVDAVTWTDWPTTPWEVSGWTVTAGDNSPASDIRIGVGVSDAGTGGTQITGRISHFSVVTSGTIQGM